MIVTDTLNGQTVEDIRRNHDGSVTVFCDSGKTITLFSDGREIKARPKAVIVDGVQLIELPSERMRLRDAFLGYCIEYVYYKEDGSMCFVCNPLASNKQKYAKSSGHREIIMTHSNGRIDELPPVSVVVNMPSLAILGAN